MQTNYIPLIRKVAASTYNRTEINERCCWIMWIDFAMEIILFRRSQRIWGWHLSRKNIQRRVSSKCDGLAELRMTWVSQLKSTSVNSHSAELLKTDLTEYWLRNVCQRWSNTVRILPIPYLHPRAHEAKSDRQLGICRNLAFQNSLPASVYTLQKSLRQ